MSDFLLELRSEEIPARMQAGARADLEKLFRKEMDAAGVAPGEITVWSTPRRLALIARDLPDATAAVSEEVKGPRVGAPPQALEGFLRKTGLSEDQLTERDGVLFAVTERPGRATAEVLAEAIPAIVRAFPWPKSQRWGAASLSTESLRWVRPLSGIVAIFGDDLVACEVGGVLSGCATKGHRFHCPGEITIGSASDYQEKLRACHVIVDHEERQDLIRTKAREVAEAAGLTLVEDEGLVIENAGLTEWPVPLLGRFDEAFLDVPPEVIQLTARTNQKYFVCEQDGKLANAFVCTANIAATDGGEAIVAGNRKVLAARLSDARFFWEQDRRTPLSHHAEKLARITFHELIGDLSQKVRHSSELARWIVSESNLDIPSDFLPQHADAPRRQAFAQLAVDTVHLTKGDLVTSMVGEFPELQGLMGYYYALLEPRSEMEAEAIRDQYIPTGSSDRIPTEPLTVAVGLADRLDTLISFFFHQQIPTGSKDPFALRRAALGAWAIIHRSNLRLSLTRAVETVVQQLWNDIVADVELDTGGLARSWLRRSKVFPEPPTRTALQELWRSNQGAILHELNMARSRTIEAILDFFADRLKVQQREAGVRHDLIDAVFALGGEDDLVRLLARVHALQAFVGTADGANLLAGYKRAANILKKEDYESQSRPAVIPANAGTQGGPTLGPRVRGDDSSKGRDDEVGEKPLSYTPEPAEKALIDALAAAGPRAEAAVAAEDFAGAMAALATLRAPIDAFFDEVTVNDADDQKRTYRLALLARFRDAVHGVADFSKIEG